MHSFHLKTRSVICCWRKLRGKLLNFTNTILHKLYKLNLFSFSDSIWSKFERSTADLQDKLKIQEAVFTIRNQCNIVLEFIEQCKEMGCKAVALLENFKDKDLLQNCINLLLEHQYLLRTGVNDVIFVHHKFASYWLIETYHVKRLEKEAIVSRDQSKKQKKAVSTKRKTEDLAVEPESKVAKIDYCLPSSSKTVDDDPPAKRLRIEREGSSRSLARQKAIQEKNEKQLKDMTVRYRDNFVKRIT